MNRAYVDGRIRLSGGDPLVMTFAEVIDVAYALLVEMYHSIGGSIFEALERVSEIGRPKVPDAPKPLALEDEASAMEALNAAMRGAGMGGALG